MRQELWREAGVPSQPTHISTTRPAVTTDLVRWIVTKGMVADALTKRMPPIDLVNLMNSGYWDFSESEEAVAERRRKQQWRNEQKRLQKESGAASS